MSNIYPSIPDPTATVESLAESVRTLKMAVELLTGQRSGGSAAHTFTQETTPTALQTGDMWIVPSTGTVNYWNGSSWMVLNPATTINNNTTATASSTTSSATVFRGFSAYLNSAQNPSTTATVVQFNAKEFDTHSLYNTSTYKFTPGVPGIWVLIVKLSFVYNAWLYTTDLYKGNGNGAASLYRRMANGAYNSEICGSCLLSVTSPDDYFQIFGFSNAGASASYIVGASETYFQAYLVQAS